MGVSKTMPKRKGKPKPKKYEVSFEQISPEAETSYKIPKFAVRIVYANDGASKEIQDISLDDVKGPNLEDLIDATFRATDKLNDYEIYQLRHQGTLYKGESFKNPIISMLNNAYGDDASYDDWDSETIIAYIRPKHETILTKLKQLMDDAQVKEINKHITKYESQGANVDVLKKFFEEFESEVKHLETNTSVESIEELDARIKELKDTLVRNYQSNLSTIQLQAASYRAKSDTRQKLPTLAAELSKEAAFERGKIYWIDTPFAPVFMRTLPDGEKLIFPYVFKDANFESAKAISYNKILETLDNKFNNLVSTNHDLAMEIAKEIDTYLRQPVNSDFDKKEYEYKAGDEKRDPRGPLNEGFFHDRDLNIYTGCLCAILLLCESSWKRNPTRGKWERGVIAQAIKNIEAKIANPFTEAFSCYIPRQVGGLNRGKAVLAGNGSAEDVAATNRLYVSDSSDEE